MSQFDDYAGLFPTQTLPESPMACWRSCFIAMAAN
jgi:hypothetical protein